MESVLRNKFNQSSYMVDEFKLGIPETVHKSKKMPRALLIKNRNSETVKTIESIRYNGDHKAFTSP